MVDDHDPPHYPPFTRHHTAGGLSVDHPERIACLCPTAWRPWCLANAIACFQWQDVPAHARRLFILADDECTPAGVHEDYEIEVMSGPAESLPAKYNVLLHRAAHWGADVIAVWEDDDLYLPWHLSGMLEAMRREKASWAQASRAWSLYTGRLEQEPARGRFHAQTVFRCDRAMICGGWPNTRRADFDQQMLARLAAVCGPPADPVAMGWPPSYVFRWASTGSPHAQTRMLGPGDETWYERAWADARQEWQRRDRPRFAGPGADAETWEVLHAVAALVRTAGKS